LRRSERCSINTITNNRDEYYSNHPNLENGFRRSTEPLKNCEIPVPNQTYRTPVSLPITRSQSEAPTNPTHPGQGNPADILTKILPMRAIRECKTKWMGSTIEWKTEIDGSKIEWMNLNSNMELVLKI
jgi:hypothetical protein